MAFFDDQTVPHVTAITWEDLGYVQTTGKNKDKNNAKGTG